MKLRTTPKHALLLAALLAGTTTTRADDAGGAPAGGEGGGEGAGAPPPAFYESFGNEGLKVSAAGWGFKSPEDLANAYANAEKRFGVPPERLMTLPADPNDAEGYRAIYSKLGLPKDAAGYGLKLDNAPAADAPDAVRAAYEADTALLNDFTQVAHKAGMPAGMAKAAVDFFVGKSAEAKAALEQAQVQQVADGKALLSKEWGGATQTREKEVRKLISDHFPKEIATALDGDQLFRHPNLAKGLAKLVERMAEPGGAPPVDAGGAQGGPLTPAQAQAALSQLEGDPVKSKALWDNGHPQHASVVTERNRLIRLADGRSAD